MHPQTATGWTALTLGILLVISNVWWFYVTFDNAITASYRDDQMRWNQEALSDALALLPAVQPMAGKSEVTAFLQQSSELASYEKDGCVWFDNLGIKFDEDDKIVHVARRWNSGEDDPCFPK
jgi:hypothetical protein